MGEEGSNLRILVCSMFEWFSSYASMALPVPEAVNDLLNFEFLTPGLMGMMQKKEQPVYWRYDRRYYDELQAVKLHQDRYASPKSYTGNLMQKQLSVKSH